MFSCAQVIGLVMFNADESVRCVVRVHVRVPCAFFSLATSFSRIGNAKRRRTNKRAADDSAARLQKFIGGDGDEMEMARTTCSASG